MYHKVAHPIVTCADGLRFSLDLNYCEWEYNNPHCDDDLNPTTSTPTKSPTKSPTQTPTTTPICPKNQLPITIETEGDSKSKKKHKNKWTLQEFVKGKVGWKIVQKNYKITSKKKIWPATKNADPVCVNKDSCFMLSLLDKGGDGIPTGYYKVTFGDMVTEGVFQDGKEWKELINCSCNK